MVTMLKKKEITNEDLAKNINTVASSVKDLTATVEKLAIMTAHGFEQVNKRFEQVDRRFEQVNKRFEQVDKRFETIDRHLELIDDDIRIVKADVHDIKMTLGPLSQVVALQDKERRDLEARVLRLERKTGIVKIS
jgi:septal ring factor EnvC (AmiA/AmiB activator)